MSGSAPVLAVICFIATNEGIGVMEGFALTLKEPKSIHFLKKVFTAPHKF